MTVQQIYNKARDKSENAPTQLSAERGGKASYKRLFGDTKQLTRQAEGAQLGMSFLLALRQFDHDGEFGYRVTQALKVLLPEQVSVTSLELAGIAWALGSFMTDITTSHIDAELREEITAHLVGGFTGGCGSALLAQDAPTING